MCVLCGWTEVVYHGYPWTKPWWKGKDIATSTNHWRSEIKISQRHRCETERPLLFFHEPKASPRWHEHQRNAVSSSLGTKPPYIPWRAGSKQELQFRLWVVRFWWRIGCTVSSIIPITKHRYQQKRSRISNLCITCYCESWHSSKLFRTGCISRTSKFWGDRPRTERVLWRGAELDEKLCGLHDSICVLYLCPEPNRIPKVMKWSCYTSVAYNPWLRFWHLSNEMKNGTSYWFFIADESGAACT